jgi:Copper amine oxidase N-terminal domain
MPYTIQGEAVSLNEEPRIIQNRLYVPLAEVVERLGGRVDWDNNNKVATAAIGQWNATIRMADRNVDVSGTPVTLIADPLVDQDVMYVPASFFHDAFGYTVDVDPGSRQVSIALPG